MGKGSREEKKPKKVAEKTNAAAPSAKGLPAGPAKPSSPAKKK